MTTRTDIKELKEYGGVLWSSAEKSNSASERSVDRKIKKILKHFNGSIWCFIKNDYSAKYISPFSIVKNVTMIDVSRVLDIEISLITVDQILLRPLTFNITDRYNLEIKLFRNGERPYVVNIMMSQSDPQLNTLADLLNEYGRSDLALKIISF